MTTTYAKRQRRPERHEREAARMEDQREREAEKRAERESRLLPLLQETATASSAWDATREQARTLPSFAFAIDPLICRGEAEKALVLGVPPVPYGAGYIEKRYGKALGNIVREVSDYRGVFLICDVESKEGDGCL